MSGVEDSEDIPEEGGIQSFSKISDGGLKPRIAPLTSSGTLGSKKPKFITKKERTLVRNTTEGGTVEATSKEVRRRKKEKTRDGRDKGKHIRRTSSKSHPEYESGSRRENWDRRSNYGRDRRRMPGREKQREEMDRIREHYYGRKSEKRKLVTDENRFKEDWDADEDTSAHNDDLYSSIVSTQLEKHRRVDIPKKIQKRGQNEPKAMQHWKEKSRSEMSDRDWRIFREDFGIANRGGKIPHPIRNWHEVELPGALYDLLVKEKYFSPTPIQMACIPIGLQNRDMIGLAETGSGKTLAFIIPMLKYVLQMPDEAKKIEDQGPFALILAPTRELVQQIEEETQKFATPLGIKTYSIVGGHNKYEQALGVAAGCDIVFGTPGRLIDCLERQTLVLNRCTYIVLDEADKMISMGFEEPEILKYMPLTNEKPFFANEQEEERFMSESEGKLYRQTFLFSATMTPAIERIARKYIRNSAYVAIGNIGMAVESVRQDVVMATPKEKFKILCGLLEKMEPPIMIFTNQKKVADFLSRNLIKVGHRSIVLHSGKIQSQREYAIDAFKNGMYPILVATSVVARGIDIKSVKNVVNYDMPNNIEEYIHRIGRTGRMGEAGVATSIITDEDEDIMFDLRKMLMDSGSRVPRELDRHPAAKIKPGTFSFKKRQETVIYTDTYS